MKESPSARTELTALDAAKITARARKYGARNKANQILTSIHKVIRNQASEGSSNAAYDLLSEGGLKGLSIAREVREMVIESLTANGYTIDQFGGSVEVNSGYIWHIRISWGK